MVRICSLVALALSLSTPALAHEAPEATSAPEATPVPEAKKEAVVLEEAKGPADWSLLRVDVEDGFALHPWIYHEVRLSERVGLLGTLHFQTPGVSSRQVPFAEFDIGPNFHFGNLQINPQLGIDLTWHALTKSDGVQSDRTGTTDFMPQLYVLFCQDRFNVESWNMYYIPFDGSTSFYMGRLLASMKVFHDFAIGPHVEMNWGARADKPDRIAVGGDLWNTFKWGQVGLFLAWESQRDVPEFRLTFLREL